MWLWTLIFLPLLAYALLLAAIYLGQTRLLFPAHAVGPAGPTPGNGQRIVLDVPVHRLHGVHLRSPANWTGDPLILVFGGNAWNAESAAAYVQDLFPRSDVVAFHYRGYAPSEGVAGARALQEDAILIHDWAKEAFPDRRIIAVGFSIGSGVAAHLAAQRPIDGAILVTPFDSLGAVAGQHYPWLPVRWLFRHPMNPAEELNRSEVAVALLIAGNDRLTPPARGEALAKAGRNVVFSRTIAGAGHNEIYDQNEFRIAIRAAMEALEAPRRTFSAG